MALFANGDFALCVFSSDMGQYLPVSEHHNIYTNAKNESQEMEGTVLYEAKDIKAWAKKQELSYPTATNMFSFVFYGDNGKQYFVKV